MRGAQTSASISIHVSNSRHRGIASTANGTSHSEYCGLHTLLVSRNAATTRKHNCATRGRLGAVKATYATAAQHSRNSAPLTVLSTLGVSPDRSAPSKPAHPVKYETTL
ncbi:hypothetical protein JD82_03503 [Prauserella rugosa]|uniref:Uncharacterized protein n=1 Tax=Prauserella rugosa TaxID=43354 RepID=A0A660CIH6_9PSEU|nr:hypothetical protein HQ32_04183 [Prauserella sp. Am3]TWH21637.1 hypothetical protein JD82_03503 [Prauserella rugosa]